MNDSQRKTEPGMQTDQLDQNSVPGLLRLLAREVPSLLTKELALARSEIRASLRATKAGAMSMAGGAVVLLAGLVILLQAAVYALAMVLQPWLSALIVGAVVVASGMVMVQAGKKKFEPQALRPDHTLDSLHKDKDAITGKSL